MAECVGYNMAEIIQETTDWPYPNHTYRINDKGKCEAYLREGTTEWREFAKPIRFEKRGRRFRKIG